ncbi:MAG: hypothetical protein JNJ88_03630 [Planctomycetes bacterium]|nr:hypothetical protein [Planctomycetota bacterium]
MRKPILVYLDSSDYSHLSDARSGERAAIMSQLRDWVRSGAITCVFSAAHISEMAPLEVAHSPAAVDRTRVLVELCGRNALISFDRLASLELASLYKKVGTSIHAVTSDGTWFPDLKSVVTPVDWLEPLKDLQENLKNQGLNRQERLRIKAALFGKNGPRRTAQGLLLGALRGDALRPILEVYPMRQEDLEVLAQYCIGLATAEEANNAFLNCLRDPQWMMKWFYRHHGKLSMISDWVRRPAKEMIQNMEMIFRDIRMLRELEVVSGERAELCTRKGWAALGDSITVRMAHQGLLKFHSISNMELSVDLVDERCRGLSTLVRTLLSSLKLTLLDQDRQMKESDFVDALHAMYAPYVSIFRSDKFMTPHVQKQVERFGTSVVSRLDDLISKIEEKMNDMGTAP